MQASVSKFSKLFDISTLKKVCRDEQILLREIQRVDSELDLLDVTAQIEYITKSFVEEKHPYSRFGRGNGQSLRKCSLEELGDALLNYYQTHYCNPSNAVLVIVSNQNKHDLNKGLTIMEKWLEPFQQSLNKEEGFSRTMTASEKSYTVGRFKTGSKQVLLHDKSRALGEEKLVFQWILNENYSSTGSRANSAIEIAFILNQIFGRRGYGSLYFFLRQRGWIISSSSVPPQIKVPVNVSGFQLLRLELPLTYEGFLNRASVIEAVYKLVDTLAVSSSYEIPKEILIQYSVIAKLYGFLLTPRPSDAIELATDASDYGIESVENRNWFRFPSPEQMKGADLERIQSSTASALSVMSQKANSVIITVAGDKAVSSIKNTNFADKTSTSHNWIKETVSGAQYTFETTSKLQTFFTDRFTHSYQDIMAPTLNPYIPKTLEQKVQHKNLRSNLGSTFYDNQNWKVLESKSNTIIFPRAPPETKIRALFVLQLLSSKPSEATPSEAANGELWRLLFEKEIKDLAELGAVGGLAYELRYNQHGLRIAIIGLGDNVSSYTKRFMKRLMNYQERLSGGSISFLESVREKAISDIKRERHFPMNRRTKILQTLEKSTIFDVALEGNKFLQSCEGAVCFSQGDLSSFETECLAADVKNILEGTLGKQNSSNKMTIPPIEDLVATPIWKPRNASICYITGISLLCDACGRVPR